MSVTCGLDVLWLSVLVGERQPRACWCCAVVETRCGGNVSDVMWRLVITCPGPGHICMNLDSRAPDQTSKVAHRNLHSLGFKELL